MIEKGISYQEDNGRKNVKVAGLKDSALYKLLKNPKMIGTELGYDSILEIINLIQNSGLVKKPLPKDLQPKYLNGNEAKPSREGIVSHLAQMTDNELRELYGGYLIPKGYREQDIMEMPIKELEYLFNQVMGT